VVLSDQLNIYNPSQWFWVDQLTKIQPVVLSDQQTKTTSQWFWVTSFTVKSTKSSIGWTISLALINSCSHKILNLFQTRNQLFYRFVVINLSNSNLIRRNSIKLVSIVISPTWAHFPKNKYLDLGSPHQSLNRQSNQYKLLEFQAPDLYCNFLQVITSSSLILRNIIS